MSNLRRFGACVLVATVIGLMALWLAAGAASAHEKRAVGQYTVFVGFASEPAVVEQPNAIDLLIRTGDSEVADPVTGAADTLKADVKFGNQTTTLGLQESDENPGEYLANFIPTAQGPYTFRIYGTINGTNIDESFTSGPDTFSEVESSSSLQFPDKIPAIGTVASTANSADDTAGTAQTLGIIGIVVGVLGLIAGVAGIMMARAARAPSTSGREPGSGPEIKSPSAQA